MSARSWYEPFLNAATALLGMVTVDPGYALVLCGLVWVARRPVEALLPALGGDGYVVTRVSWLSSPLVGELTWARALQAEVLEKVCDGRIITFEDLHRAQILPASSASRNPPASTRTSCCLTHSSPCQDSLASEGTNCLDHRRLAWIQPAA